MKNIDLNSVVLCSTGRVGIVSGFEDYSTLKLFETRDKPEHKEYRVIVEFSDESTMYFSPRELELFEG